MSADDFFNEGAPSAISTIQEMGDVPGTTLAGEIVEIGEAVQQKDLKTGLPATWDDGNPKMMLPITIATTVKTDADDDGHRTFWVSGNLKKAIGAAIRHAGARLQVGGHLSVTFTGYGEAKKGFNPPRMWSATYTPPAPGASFFGEQAQPAAAAPWSPPATAPAPGPVAAPVAAPAAAPDQAAMLDALPPDARAAVMALLSAK